MSSVTSSFHDDNGSEPLLRQREDDLSTEATRGDDGSSRPRTQWRRRVSRSSAGLRGTESDQDSDNQYDRGSDEGELSDGPNNFVSVGGEGAANIAERRGEFLLANLFGFFSSLCMNFPVYIVMKATCCPGQTATTSRANVSHDGSEGSTGEALRDYSDSSALYKRVWPKGFGPGWWIRTFCPLILLGWSLVLYYGVKFGPDLLSSLNGVINAPEGSQSAIAQNEYAANFLHAIGEDYPTQTTILVERLDGKSVLTPEVEIFSTLLQRAMQCGTFKEKPKHICSNELDWLKTVNSYDGYFMRQDQLSMDAVRPFYVNANESATLILVKHDIRVGLGKSYFDYLDQVIARNGPNPSLYRVSFANEQKLLIIAQDQVVYDFEHADLIGIPFAWVFLVWYCGFPAFIVLLSLPICLLASFWLSVQWMPHGLQLPTFAPSMIVSMGVALNVDYALFMLVRYAEELNRGASRNFALDKAMSTAGKTIAVSGTIMLMSNGCLYFVKAETVASLGVALAVTNLVTIVTNLSLVPALLFVLGPLLDRLRLSNIPTAYGVLMGLVALLAHIFWTLPYRLLCRSAEPFQSGTKNLMATNATGDTSLHISETEDPDTTERTQFLSREASIVSSCISEFETSSQLGQTSVDPSYAVEGHSVRSANLDTTRQASSEQLVRRRRDHTSLEDTQDEIENTVVSTTSRQAKRSLLESSKALTSKSRIWASVATLCLKYPKLVILTVIGLCAPLCWQCLRFTKTDSQANLVPGQNAYVQNFDLVLNAGFVPGWLADFKAILASPLPPSAQYNLTKDSCFDDNKALRLAVAELKDRTFPSLPDFPPLENLSCDNVAKYCNDPRIPPKAAFILPNFCPYTCNSCRPELVQSKEFFQHIQQVTSLMQDVLWQFMDDALESASDRKSLEASMIESPTFYLGKHFTWEHAKKLLESNVPDPSWSVIDRLYVEHYHTMTGIHSTRALFRFRPPFHPYNDKAHLFSTKVRETVLEAGYNDPSDTAKYRFYFGGATVRLFDQVEQVYLDTPPIMITAVVLTVMGMSIVVFQSLLLGPRLLITVAITIGIVFGMMVLVFQDLGASPDGAGLYWIVPILGVPIMVGCTLDYDSFVCSRAWELRSASLSTEAAVFIGLQETGHVITIAGVIMTAAFGSMLFSAIPVVQQIGALLVACCLMDTFLIRTLLVPSLMLVAVEMNWFPKQMPPVTITMDMLRNTRRERQPSTSSHLFSETNTVVSSTEPKDSVSLHIDQDTVRDHSSPSAAGLFETANDAVPSYHEEAAQGSQVRSSSDTTVAQEGDNLAISHGSQAGIATPPPDQQHVKMRSNSGGSWASLARDDIRALHQSSGPE